MTEVRGETAVVVVADAVESAVARWRSRYDSSAAVGVPAHVTVLYPFLPLAQVTAAVLRRLREICAAEPAFEVGFARFGRFPGGVLWLEPEPAEPFRRLTYAVWQAWPQAPPYGGLYDGVVPHLTVAEHDDEALLDEIEAQVERALPITMPVTGVQLLAIHETTWSARARFALGAAVSP
jgi:2'-5' RNA ligase